MRFNQPLKLQALQFQRFFKILMLSLLLALSACSREGEVAFDKTIKKNQPDSFAAFINPVAGLASGAYVIEARADTAGDAGDFTLSVTYDDGTTEEYTGSWTADIATSTRTFNIMLFTAGGLKITLESAVESNLRLLNANGFVVAVNDAALPANSSISFETSRIDSAAYGAAYYAAVDPDNDKDTLEKWKVANGFYDADAAGRVIEPRFRDTKDLGYGRGMRLWTKPDGSLYIFVENFQVRTIPGQEYTSLNLEALLTDNRKHHFGSNAIEFSTFPYGPGEPCAFASGAACATTNPAPPKFAKFFTFDATLGDQTKPDHVNETRLNEVNLDDRGAKSMPGACIYCHGGTLRPLRADGSFRDNTLDGSGGNGIDGDVNAKLQLLEVHSFEYGDVSPFTRAEQEPIIKRMNMAIYCSYPNLPADGIQAACAQFCVDPANTADCDGKGTDILTVFGSTTIAGQWDGGFAAEMAAGWYDDPAIAGMFDRATFNEDYVPLSWQHDSNDNMPPAGSEQLFLEVVQPTCFVCHSHRGTTLGSVDTRASGKDIDFNSYEKFISHAEQIKQYVYDSGVMPLSLRGYNAFWAGSSIAPEVLALHLNGLLAADNQIPLDDKGEVARPGAPVVDAGPDRTSTSPVRLFGANSQYLNRYGWRIISQPAGSDAVLTDSNTSRPLFTTSIDGDYEIRLVAAFDSTVVSDSVHIKIDSSMTALTDPPDPKKITFDTHIKPIFSTAGGDDLLECDQCHSGTDASKIAGVPVFWLDDANQPVTGSTWYDEILSRVDFKDPENSLILTKPSNNHHFGGLRGGFEVGNQSNRHNYDLILNWILEGAPEN